MINTKKMEVEVGDRVVCDGLQTSQFGKVIGVGSDEHSIKLLINGEERYEPDYCLLEVTAKNKRAVELLLIHFKQIIAERDREVVEMIGAIDFYGWDINTQRMIKDKIINSLKK